MAKFSCMKEKLQQSHKFRLWKGNLEQNGLEIHEIEEIYTRYRHNGEALFSLLMLDATTPEGPKIPPICFLKGEVVSVLICLIDKESREKFLLLVKQRRICTGDYIYEQVAGMVDGEDDPWDVAVREAAEETGVAIAREQLHSLNKAPYYASTGTSDEALYFFYCELEMNQAQIASYHNKEMGLHDEHEHIYTHVCSIPEALRLITNTNGLLNVYLYLQAIQELSTG